MSTLTRTHSSSTGKKPQYKDYVSFLDSYRNGKKDDQISVVTSDSGVGFSLHSSTNNSSNSVFSDVSDSAPTPKPKQTVKTEMYIEIKDPVKTFATQRFEVHKQNSSPQELTTVSVSNAAKIFEAPKDGKSSMGELSKKFQFPSKARTKRASSIDEVSKIFENSQPQTNTLHKQRNFNAVPKPFQPKYGTLTPPKPTITSPKPTMVPLAPAFPKFQEPSRSYADSVDSALSSLSVSPSPPRSVSPPIGGPLSPPPPPPPPMPSGNFTSKPPKVANGHKVVVQTQNNSQTLDKNDPRVKKAVYGALRNMYGAYHDQANDYLSTLPKNRVKKNNGLDSIIDSIASQGGLEKLNGRVNPKPEVAE